MHTDRSRFVRRRIAPESGRRPSPTLVTIDRPEELEAWRGPWTRLAARRGHLMAHFPWCAAALETLAGPGDGRIFALVDGDRLLAALPMRRRPTRGLVSLGGGGTGEPTPLLYEDPDHVGALMSAALQRARGVELERLTAFGEEAEAIRRAARRRALVVQRPAGRTPYLPLVGGYGEWFRSRSSRRRGDWTRARRRAGGSGPVSFTFHRPDGTNVEGLLEVAFDIEARSWKAETGTALALDERLGPFFRALAPRLADNGELVIAFMSVGDRPVAMQIAVEFARRYWVLKVGHDEEMSGCSPGILLMVEAIRHAFERGLICFEFLGNDAPWIRQWTDRTRPMCSMSLMPLRSPTAWWRTGRRLIGEVVARYRAESSS